MVNTFLPYADFGLSVKCLDDRRCGKQRIEAYQLIQALFDPSKGWSNHPACIMWRGYENALIYYYNLCVTEWISRGKQNTKPLLPHGEVVMPWWVGWDHFHASHQASLLRKFPHYYGRYFTYNEYYYNRGYLWPSKVVFLLNSWGTDPTTSSEYRSLSDLYYINQLFDTVDWSTIKPVEQTYKDLYTKPILIAEAERRGYQGIRSWKKDDLMRLLELI
jgi:hypothetical protein